MIVDKPADYLEELRREADAYTELVAKQEDERRAMFKQGPGPSRLRECVSAEDLEEEPKEKTGLLSRVMGLFWNY